MLQLLITVKPSRVDDIYHSSSRAKAALITKSSALVALKPILSINIANHTEVTLP